MSRALWHIGVVEMGLLWCNYFDDLPSIELEILMSSGLNSAEGFLDLLGWTYAREDKKRHPFESTFGALGAAVL